MYCKYLLFFQSQNIILLINILLLILIIHLLLWLLMSWRNAILLCIWLNKLIISYFFCLNIFCIILIRIGSFYLEILICRLSANRFCMIGTFVKIMLFLWILFIWLLVILWINLLGHLIVFELLSELLFVILCSIHLSNFSCVYTILYTTHLLFALIWNRHRHRHLFHRL